MEAPVSRIVILRVAVRVQRPELHGCVASVIWKAQHHRVPRTTVRTVDVWIAGSRIRRIEELSQAFIAKGKVWRDADGRMVSTFADANREPFQADRFRRSNIDVRYAGGWRRLRSQGAHERVEAGFGSFEMDFNAFLTIQNPTRQSVLSGETIDKRTKTNSLHHTPHAYGTGTRHG
jgi:hypothetical protein